MFCSYLWDIAARGGGASLDGALRAILKNQSYAHTTFWDRLTARQRNLMIALAKGASGSLHAAKEILTWGLGSSATVTKAIKSLEREGYVESSPERPKPSIADPFFAEWIRRL